MNQEQAASEPVFVRCQGRELLLDIVALTALVQRDALDPDSEVKSDHLTQGEWRRLRELGLYAALRVRDLTSRPAGATSATSILKPEQNLEQFFKSWALKQMKIDALVAVISVGLSAGLSIIVHRSVLILALMLLTAGLAYLLADRVLFLRWVKTIRRTGYKRLPWSSRFFTLAAAVVPGYFFVASFLPLLPREWLFQLVDGTVGIMFALAGGIVWTFHRESIRMEKAFRLSADVSPRPPT